MDRPCLIAIKCPGPQPGLEADSPITNYSAEYDDGPEFTGIWWGTWNPLDPDHPGWWAAQACAGLYECVSFISQDDADACARRISDICGYTPPGLPTGVPTECWYLPSSCQQPPPTLYYNTQQGCSLGCPDGTAYTWVIPAGWIVADNQALANEVARNLACKLVAERRLCVSGLSSQPCKGTPYAALFSVSGAGAPFTIRLIGGSLPPGIAFVQNTIRTGAFFGTCPVAGVYTVTIQATAISGWSIVKTFSLAVMGILNDTILTDASVGVAYSEQLVADGGTPPYTFSIENGSLPDGLTMSTEGLISGTPTTEETQDINIRVTDSSP